jgi:hypothetical protein
LGAKPPHSVSHKAHLSSQILTRQIFKVENGMKHFALPALALALAPFIATPAAAWNGHVVECFDKVYVEPEFRTTKHLVKEAEMRLEHRNGGGVHQVYRMHYPAIYEERRQLVRPGHYVLRPAPCRKG